MEDNSSSKVKSNYQFIELAVGLYSDDPGPGTIEEYTLAVFNNGGDFLIQVYHHNRVNAYEYRKTTVFNGSKEAIQILYQSIYRDHILILPAKRFIIDDKIWKTYKKEMIIKLENLDELRVFNDPLIPPPSIKQKDGVILVCHDANPIYWVF